MQNFRPDNSLELERATMIERRDQIRKSTGDYFIVYDCETNEKIGRIIDLSIEGAMLVSESMLPVPMTYKCMIEMPQMIGRHKELHFEAECKWCKQNNRLGWYESGFKIIGLSDTDREILDELTSEWTEKKPPMLTPTR